jgi:hypothetical protein
MYIGFDEFKVGFDNFDFTDADNETYNRLWRMGANVLWDYSKDASLVIHTLTTHTKRDTRSSFPTLFNAQGTSIDAYSRNKFDLKSFGDLQSIVGLNYREDAFESYTVPFGESQFTRNLSKDRAIASIIDPYLNLTYISPVGLTLQAGVRYNKHENYDGQWVYQINPSYSHRLGDHVLKPYVSISSAYITPSLFQLYDPSFGNEDLLPEINTTQEVGVEWFIKTAVLPPLLFAVRKRT